MGLATAALAERFAKLKPDVVLVVGDRVEAFAAASAAHVGGQVLAHVHGGDRALGQVDDALRHAISKLAHVHFAATRQSGDRLLAMGEDRWRIRVVGAPGVDGIRQQAARVAELNVFSASIGLQAAIGEHALLLLHPTDANDRAEALRTRKLLTTTARTVGRRIIALMPNNDPGSDGIAAELWRAQRKGEAHLVVHAPRPVFLGLLRDCRALVGNSSAGIIEAGSFGTPVLDIGPRQQGRERGGNVAHVGWEGGGLERAVMRVARARRSRLADNPYERGGAARRIVPALATLPLDARLRRKVIRY
jgi:UDP-hydrolysing UDP-N-acetyl-D-glucosamine 2-epimerase